MEGEYNKLLELANSIYNDDRVEGEVNEIVIKNKIKLLYTEVYRFVNDIALKIVFADKKTFKHGSSYIKKAKQIINNQEMQEIISKHFKEEAVKYRAH